MALVFPVIRRGISTTTVVQSKKNFRKFHLPNKRGTREFKERQKINPDPDIPIDNRGTKKVGYKLGNRFIPVPEMIPELIVPDLTGFNLKPYVSYRSTRVTQSEFTPKDLFDAVYASKIKNDFDTGKLDKEGNPLDPNAFEKLTPQEAKDLAGKTGCDLFEQQPVPLKKPWKEEEIK